MFNVFIAEEGDKKEYSNYKDKVCKFKYYIIIYITYKEVIKEESCQDIKPVVYEIQWITNYTCKFQKSSENFPSKEKLPFNK